MRVDYHTALHAPITDIKPCQHYVIGHSSAYVGNGFSPLAYSPFKTCDVLWAEPPWQHGYDEFYRRAGHAPEHSWAELLCTLEWNLLHHGDGTPRNIPAVMVVGKNGRKALRHNPKTVPAILNGAPALLAVYGGLDLAEFENHNVTLAIKYLAKRYWKIGDPMCGYGRTGRYFAEAGKNFCLFDVNPLCIGYIAVHAESWFPA